MSATIAANGLTHRFGVSAVLDQVDLDIRGGVVTLLGANGAGKTTLLRCVVTALAPTAGTVRIDGLDPSAEAERVEIRRRIGYLPQQIGFSRPATVFDTLDYAGVLKELFDERQRRQLVVEALEQVGLRDRMSDNVLQLSGGMKQRLGLAHALLGSPPILVLDEPSAGLDPGERQRLRSLISERRSIGTTLVSTHLTEEAALGDTVVVLHGGRIVFSDPPAKLVAIAQGRAWVTADLPPPGTLASWRLPDGRFRSLGPLGVSPAGAQVVEPTIEDGYLLLTRS